MADRFSAIQRGAEAIGGIGAGAVDAKAGGGRAAPSLREEFRNLVNLLPDDYKIDQKTMASLMETARKSYDEKTRGEYGLQREAMPLRSNPLKDRTETFRGDEIQQRMGFRGELHPYAVQRAALTNTGIGDANTFRRADEGRAQERQDEWMTTQDLTQMGLAQQQRFRGELHPLRVRRDTALAEEPENRVKYGREQHQEWVSQAPLRSRRELAKTGKAEEDQRWGKARADQEAEGINLVKEKVKTEAARGGNWTKKTQLLGQPPQVPRSAVGGGGGGRAPLPQKPYEVRRQEYIDQRLEAARKSRELPAVEEAAEVAGPQKGAWFSPDRPYPKEAAFAREQELAAQYGADFDRLYGSQQGVQVAGSNVMEQIRALEEQNRADQEELRRLEGGGP